HPEPLSIPRSRPRAPPHANCAAELPSPAPPGQHPRTASSSYEPTVPTRRCVVPPPPPSAPPAERTAPLAASDRSSSSMASPSPLLRSGPQPRPEQETMTRGTRNQRLRRTVHPHPQRAMPLGRTARHRRRPPPGCRVLDRDLQQRMAHPTPRPQDPTRSIHLNPRRGGSMKQTRTLSNEPGAVQGDGDQVGPTSPASTVDTVV